MAEYTVYFVVKQLICHLRSSVIFDKMKKSPQVYHRRAHDEARLNYFNANEIYVQQRALIF